MVKLIGEELYVDGVNLPEGFCLRKKKDSIRPPLEGIYLVFTKTGRIAGSWSLYAKAEHINERIQRAMGTIEEIRREEEASIKEYYNAK